MDAAQAFSAVERGSSVAATGNTGAGFSFASSANGGAAGGLGGARGLSGGGLGGGGLGGLGGLSSLFGGLNSQSQQNTKPAVRTRLRSAVVVAPRSPQVVQQRAGQRIQTFSQPGLGGMNVTMEGRRAVVTGVVADDRQRRMSELLLRLEPGVSEIDNRIEVAGP
jgi:hypothetical protein